MSAEQDTFMADQPDYNEAEEAAWNSTPDRDDLIAKASWWAGWTIDNEDLADDMPELCQFLMSVKAQMQDDCNEILCYQNRGDRS